MNNNEEGGEATGAEQNGAARPLPTYARSVVVVDPPGNGPGYWAGGPSAVLGQDGAVYLAYRLRRPLGVGRGYANVIARSVDGETFETIALLDRESFDCESLERPALVALPGGGWRLYVSCATPGTKHWRVDAVDSATPDGFNPLRRRTVLPGTAAEGLKDPVVVRDGDRWQMWVCAHPLDVTGDEDRMTTRYATSSDGIEWQLNGTALAPRPGTWDARGTRITSVLWTGRRAFAYYDGRARAADNAEELTGIAVATGPGRFRANGEPVRGAPSATGSLRYVSVIPQSEGYRLYYEATRLDGAHDLRTEYVPRPVSPSQS